MTKNELKKKMNQLKKEPDIMIIEGHKNITNNLNCFYRSFNAGYQEYEATKDDGTLQYLVYMSKYFYKGILEDLILHKAEADRRGLKLEE